MDTVFAILKFFGVLLQVILVFNLIIIVLEWGHVLAARWRGLKVEKFQIWFGKPIWKKTESSRWTKRQRLPGVC